MSGTVVAETLSVKKWDAVEKWAAIDGQWSFSKTGPHFTPGQKPDNLGIALANVRFRDGVVRCHLTFQDREAKDKHNPMQDESAGIILGYHSEMRTYHVVGLGAFNASYAIWEFTGTGWYGRRVSGIIQNLHYNRDYSIEVDQRGQRISLLVDEVPVLEHVLASPLAGNQLGLYAMSKSPVQFRNVEIQKREPMAFVVMQFGEPYDILYREVIRPGAQSLGFEVKGALTK